jgi:C_GCAxxG_C_C family probable redox protein
MKDRVKDAVEMFKEGYSCSQAIFATYGGELGIEREAALKIAAGLGGGIGKTGETCGALTGAILILGLKFGTTNPKDTSGKYHCYSKSKAFCDEFKARCGTLICRELLGFDFNTPEGLELSKQPGAFQHCPEFVQIAAEILESMLEKP